MPCRVDRPPGPSHRYRRLGSEAPSELGDGGVEVSVGDHPVRQPDPQGLVGVDDVAE